MSIRRSMCAMWALLALTTAGNLAAQPVTITAVSPAQGAYAGQTMQLTVANLPTTVASVSLTITPPAGAGSPVTFPSVNIHAAPVPPNRIVQFVVPASLATSVNIPNCQVSISQASGTPFSSNSYAFTLLGVPVISVVSPGAWIAGSSTTVEIVGVNTNFSTASVPSISGSDGTTIARGGTCPSPNDATHLCAIVTIPPGATLGPRTVTVTTSSELATLAGAFAVVATQRSFDAISPASCAQGQSLPVTLIGQGTHFSPVAPGATTANFGDSVTVSGPLASPACTALTCTFQVTCNPLAPVGPRTVTAVTGSEFALGINQFTVTSGTAAISSVTPASEPQGANATITLHGSGTHWIQGGTSVSFGAGINVGNMTVTNPLLLTANISVAPNAAPGARTVVATTNGEVAGLNNAFTVTAGTPSISAMSPDVGTQGTTLNVAISGTFLTFLGTATANFGPNITANGAGTLTAGGATITFNIAIAPVAATGTRTVTVTNGSTDYSFPFTVAPSSAALSSVTPNSGSQGGSYALEVIGTGTHWVQGTTTASLAPGIVVNRTIVNPASSTQAEVDITVPASQSARVGSLTMSTGGEVVTLPQAFTVLPATPSCTVAPSSGMIGNSVPVEFVCQFSHLSTATQANIDGNGISNLSQSFQVSGTTTASAILVIDPAAPAAPAVPCTPGNRDITLTTGAEIITFPFCVTSTPAVLTSIAPYTAQPGSSLTVTITGQNTNFAQGVTQVGFGPNIGPTPIVANVTSPTSLTAAITIAANAAPGWRQAFVDTASEQLSIGFLVGGPSATLSSVSPSSGAQGQTLTVAIAGNGTNFACLHSPCDPPGTNPEDTVASLGQGVTVNSLTVLNPTTATANIAVSPTAPTGPRGVTMTTGAEVVAAPLFAVTTGIATISAIQTNPATTPPSVAQFAVVNFEITGSHTNWLKGETTLNFGPGIAVNQFTVNSPTDITGQMTVSSNALIGYRSISATTGGEVASSFSEALLVTPAIPTLLNITPGSGQQGTVVSVLINGQATHWGAATTASLGNSNGITAAVNATSATQATLTVTILGTAYTGTYNLTVTTNLGGGNIEQVSLPAVFTVTQGAAILTSVVPNQGAQGATLPVVITGQNTNFQSGVTAAAFSTGGCPPAPTPTGINVTNVQVTDNLHATLSLAIDPAAGTGLRTLCLATLGENVAYGNAFTVQSGTPTLNGVAPVSGEQGQTVPVTVIGQFTHWLQGTTTATFGQGITVNNPTITSATGATATLVIDPLAFTGSRTVTFTTGGEVVEGNLFSVTAGPAIISSISPGSGNQGQNVFLQINGENTNWADGLTQFSISGAGLDIKVNGFQVLSATSALANLSISAAAALGTRTIFLSTGGENVSDSAAFVVTGGIPSILQGSPSSVLPGSNAVNLVITGGYTQWSCGTGVALPCPLSASTNTQASLAGPGDFTIIGGTINSNTSITLVVNVSPTAAIGLHTLTVQTGTQALTANVDVASNTPSISYETPNMALVGQTVDVQFAGQYTQWAQGVTSAAFGTGIALNTFQVLDATTATANITIAANASTGPRTVTFSTGAEIENTTFSVTIGTPSLVLIDPGSAIQGQTLNLDVVGQYTTFNGTTQFTSIPGITVNGWTIFSATSARVNISASTSATVGVTPLTETTTGSPALSINFAVTPSQAVITSLVPNTALQGTSVNVTLTGFLTHWNGSTTFSFGSGITSSNIVVNNATSATMTLSVAPLAPTGASAATATTGGEVATLNNAFVVQPGTPILLSSTPGAAQQGTNFSLGILGQYTSFDSTTSVTLGPGVSNIVVTPTSATSLTVTGFVSPLAYIGISNIVVTTGTQVLTLYGGFSIVSGTAAISLLNPAQSNQGQTLNVAITGSNTHFQSGITTASFGPGITLNGVLSVTDGQDATANITIASNATPALNTVTLTTLGETATAPAAFQIVASTPVINYILPTSAVQGSNPSITVSSSFTHFVQGTTTATFSPNDVTATVTVTTSGATLSASVSPTAVLGAHTLTMTTNSEVVTLTNSFTVTAGPAAVSSVAPNSARRGATAVSLLVTGSATHFGALTQAAFSGGGVSVVSVTPVAASNGLQATAVVNIDPAAALGARALTMTTGGEVATLASAFTVNAALLSITTTSLPYGTTGASYSQTIGVVGGVGPYNFSVSSGSLPSPLTLGTTTGLISGKPAAAGTSTPTIQVTDQSSQLATMPYTFNVYDPLTLGPASIPSGVSGIAYSQTVVASGGAAPLTLSQHSGSLPTGVTFNSSTGAISGTPTVTGGFNVDIRVTDNNSDVTDQPYSFTVYGPLLFTTTTLPDAHRTLSYSQPIVFSGGVPTVTLSVVGTLPAGLQLTGNAITGTPAAAGLSNFQLKMTDANGDTQLQSYSLNVEDAISITTASLPNGVVGVYYSQTVVTANGVAPVNFGISAGTLPTNLNLDPTSGAISGTPSVANTFNFTVQATDGLTLTASVAYTVTIAPPPLITQVSPNQLQAGQSYSITLTGQNTNWVNGATTASFGPGVNVTGVTVSSATSATAAVSVNAAASGGSYNVVVTTGSEVATLTGGITILAAPPSFTLLSPGSAKAGTTATVTVTGQSMLGATFAFQNPIPGVSTVPGPINVVSNDGSTAVLTFPAGSAEGQYTLVATTTLGASTATPPSQFVVLNAGTYTLDSALLSVLNVAPPSQISAHGLMDSPLVSIVNIAPPAQLSAHGLMDSPVLSVLNVAPPAQLSAHGLTDSGLLSVLNVAPPNQVSGHGASASLLVAVCNVASGCTAVVPQTLSLPRAPQSAADVIAPQAALNPSLQPVESLDSIVEGRSILLTAEWVNPGDSAMVDFEVNGAVIGTATAAPYNMLFTVPAGIRELAFRAIVQLPSGAVASSQSVRIPVAGDTGVPVKLPKLERGETATLFAGGLKAEYFAFARPLAAMPPLDGLVPGRTGFVTAVNQPNPGALFGDDPIGAALPGDFAVRFSGDLWIEGGGHYNFWLGARNGAELLIDGNVVTDTGTAMSSPAEAGGAVTLAPGWHKIEVRYFLAVGAESVRLEWAPPGAPRQVISPQYFRTALTGVPAEAVPAMFDSVWVRLQEGGGTREMLLRPLQ